MKGIRRLFGFTARSTREIERDVADEFAFHLDMRIADLVRDGHSADEARAIAMREFGDVAGAVSHGRQRGVEVERRRRFSRIVADLRQDLSYGWRLATRTRGFSAVAILTLAVSIGGNTAVFSVVNAVLLRPPALADPATLVRVSPGESRMSWPNYRDIAERADVFTGVAATRGLLVSYGDARLNGDAVTPNFFTLLGVGASLGRTILPSDSRTDLVVLSDRGWRTRFGADPSVIGRVVTLDQRPFEIIGVMPPRFRGVAPAGLVRDFWLPVDAAAGGARFQDRTRPMVQAIARLKPGVSRAQATAAARVVAADIRAQHTEVPVSFEAVELSGFEGIETFRGMGGAVLPVFAFVALLGLIAAAVLLIGCANIAGLLLGRAAARQREIAVRLALGAARGRIIRQLMTESLVLATAGGVAGLVLATWLARSFNLLLAQLPFAIEFDVSIDARVAAYAMGLSLIATMLFGLSPARRAARIDLVGALKDESSSRSRQRLRGILLAGQVAVSTMLLFWAGLFALSLVHATDINPGFDPSGVLVADVDLGAEERTDAERDAIFVALQQRVAAAPGVESTGMAWAVPLALMSNQRYGVYTDADDTQGAARRVMGNSMSPGWLATVKIPLLDGRDFSWADREGAPKVAIVNDTAARQFWNGRAVGKTLAIPTDRGTFETVTVVGVAGDSKYWTLGETIAPLVYRPTRQTIGNGLVLHVRTRDPRTATEVIRTELKALAPTGTVETRSMTDATAVAVMPARAGALFTAGFGLVAILLAAMGIYAVVSYSVAARTREIGVRRAIGARTLDIVRLIAVRTSVLVGVGLAIGLTGGTLGASALGGLIIGVPPGDPLTLASVAAIVLTCAALASAYPAWRASRVEALTALRAE